MGIVAFPEPNSQPIATHFQTIFLALVERKSISSYSSDKSINYFMNRVFLNFKLVAITCLSFLNLLAFSQTGGDILYHKHLVDLGGFTCGSPSRFIGQAHLAVSPSGNKGYVAWNVSGNSENEYAVGALHITPLNSAFQRSGNDLVLPGFVINDILATDEVSISLLAGKVNNNSYIKVYPNELYILKLDLNGNILWKVLVAGGQGHGPQAEWPDFSISNMNLVFNGSEYAAYFSLMKNWAKVGAADDVHQGDKFVVVSKEGKLIEPRTRTWKASHSNILYLASNESAEFTTLTTGDGYPFGVLYTNVNTAKEAIIWPPKEVRELKPSVTWVGTAGRSGGMIHKNGLVYVLINTDKTDKLLNGDNDKPDDDAMVLLKLDESGAIVGEYWLAQDLYGGGEARLVPYGTGFAIINNVPIPYDDKAPFGSSFSPNAVIRVINSKGELIQAPVELLRSVYSDSEKVIALPNGGIAWASVRYGAQQQIEITEILAPNATSPKALNASKDNLSALKADNYAGILNFLKPLSEQKFNGIVKLNGDILTNEGVVSNGQYDNAFNNGLSIVYNEFDYTNFSMEVKFKYVVNQKMPVFALSSQCRLIVFGLNENGMVEVMLNNAKEKMTTDVVCAKEVWHTAKISYSAGTLSVYLDNDLLGKKTVVLSATCASGNSAELCTTNYSNGSVFNGVIESVIIK